MAKKTAARVECPSCVGWKNTHAGQTPQAFGFTLDGRTWHYAPDVWMAGRIQSYGWSDEARRQAMEDWTVGCACEAQMEAQRQADAA